MKTLTRRIVTLTAAVALVPLAQAHPGHAGHDFTWDFSTGFAHPFTGWDHILAMVAVGWWAAQLGGRARWLVPATFVAMMSLGAALGRFGFVVPGVEQAIAASVCVLGLMIALAARLPVAWAATMVGGFAVFHGFAHGIEVPAASVGLLALSGFAAATALLHATGLALGVVANRAPTRVATIVGSLIAGFGVCLFAG